MLSSPFVCLSGLLKWRWLWCAVFVLNLNLNLGWWLWSAGEGVGYGGWEHTWRGKWRRRIRRVVPLRTALTTTLLVTLSTLTMAVFSSFVPPNTFPTTLTICDDEDLQVKNLLASTCNLCFMLLISVVCIKW